jgi:outer membrane protein OmpA-like peptidoglycan-associated protein
MAMIAAGCATVPSDAPQEFKDAKASLDRADDENVDRLLPITMNRAEHRFDEALDQYKASSKGDKDQSVTEATAKARDVFVTTERARQLRRDMRMWDDENLQPYADLKAAPEKIAALQAERDKLASTPPPAPKVIETGVKDVNLTTSVAYFDTGKTVIRPVDEAKINDLQKTLAANSGLTVTLRGISDPRGNAMKNRELARERAESVANRLVAAGIDKARIKVEAGGEEGSTATKRHNLALDRRVDAVVVSTAH